MKKRIDNVILIKVNIIVVGKEYYTYMITIRAYLCPQEHLIYQLPRLRRQLYRRYHGSRSHLGLFLHSTQKIGEHIEPLVAQRMLGNEKA